MRNYQRGFSSIILLVLIMLAVIAGIIFYFSRYQESQNINQVHTSSGVYDFDDVFKTDSKTLGELESIFKQNYQQNRNYTTNIRATDYYPFQDLNESVVRNRIMVRVQEQNGEITSYCIVYKDHPDDVDDAICIDTQNPEIVPNEEHYTASFFTKLKLYKR
ncbi:MAG: hypothetical protein V4519_05215 [Patescibacteria group bacterium]